MDVVTAREDCQVGKVVRLFESKGLRYIPVVDQKNKVVGVVGRRDILSYYMMFIESGNLPRRKTSRRPKPN